MRKLLAIVPVLALAAACSAGARHGDGARAQRSFEVGAFERIDLAGSHDVIVTVGGAPSVRAEGDSGALERLEIGVENGALRIANRSGRWSWFGGRHRGVTVRVTVPALTAASVSGSGDMRVDRVEGQSFAAAVTGSGALDLPNVRVAEASFALTGSGGIRGAGAARRATVSLTGSGDIDLAGLETADAGIALVGSGDINARATGTAAVDLRGSGDVTVAGPARCTISKSGSGDVRCGS
ncbi:MAG TPA: head GIN domain-containing protein [Allosphingosinicella sp.]|nr:head GIN domain-containing protein [Allosphingosinicella sp.]